MKKERIDVEFRPDPALRFHRAPVRVVVNCATYAKNVLRGYLIKHFPTSFEIAFTPGNFDESPWALIIRHNAVVRLMKQPMFQALISDHPLILYRPYRCYLAHSFRKRERREIFLQHYRYLAARVRTTFFVETLRDQPLVWKKAIGSDVFEIRLSFAGELHHEGDLLLEFQENSVPLYHLSFTIVPGHLAGATAEHAMLVGRIQGVAGKLDAIRSTTKKCRDVSPPYLLMAAVQGISQALDVGLIAGVKNAEQITLNQSQDSIVYFDYDAFWRTYLAEEAARFFLISVPVPEKPIEQISAGHRGRTRSKRAFKYDVVASSEAAFDGFLLAPRRRSMAPMEPDTR